MVCQVRVPGKTGKLLPQEFSLSRKDGSPLAVFFFFFFFFKSFGFPSFFCRSTALTGAFVWRRGRDSKVVLFYPALDPADRSGHTTRPAPKLEGVGCRPRLQRHVENGPLAAPPSGRSKKKTWSAFEGKPKGQPPIEGVPFFENPDELPLVGGGTFSCQLDTGEGVSI